jgi:hypothetical protein
VTDRQAEAFAIILALAIGWQVFDIAMGVGSVDAFYSLAPGSSQALRWAALAVLISAFVWVLAAWIVGELSRVHSAIAATTSDAQE